MSGPFKMKGSGHYGYGNQKRKDGMPFTQYLDMAKNMMPKESPADYASPAKDYGHEPEKPEGHKHSKEDKASMTGVIGGDNEDKIIDE